MATKDLKQQSNRIVQNRGAVQPAAHGKTVRPEGAEPVPREAVPRVSSPAPKAQVKRNGEAGHSTAREAFGPPALGSYHGRNQDGRLRVQLGQQRYLVVGAITHAVEGSGNGVPRWQLAAKYRSKGFEFACPWNWDVVVTRGRSEELLRITGLFYALTDPSPATKPVQNAVASDPTQPQLHSSAQEAEPKVTASSKPGKSKKAGKQRSDEDYKRERERAQREFDAGLDPQVRPWFAERFLDISHATLNRKFPPIRAESSGSKGQIRKNGGARYMRYAELVAYRDARVAGGGEKSETDAGRQLVGGKRK